MLDKRKLAGFVGDLPCYGVNRKMFVVIVNGMFMRHALTSFLAIKKATVRESRIVAFYLIDLGFLLAIYLQLLDAKPANP